MQAETLIIKSVVVKSLHYLYHERVRLGGHGQYRIRYCMIHSYHIVIDAANEDDRNARLSREMTEEIWDTISGRRVQD